LLRLREQGARAQAQNSKAAEVSRSPHFIERSH